MAFSRIELNNGKYIDDQMANGVPEGGTTGQVLAKTSGNDYETGWITSTGSGTVTSIATTSPITGGTITTTGTIGISQATTSTDGYLSSTDWNTFNGKFNLPSLTAGSVLFSNGTTIAQDNANFFWNDTNNRLGIGTATPAKALDIKSDALINELTVGQGNLTTLTIEWSSTNLDVEYYRNGDIIPQVTDPTAWANLTTGAWCYYNNDPANGPIYGKLYNWYAVNDPRGLAPAGWHVPTDAEWTNYITLLGASPGGKMKETGTAHWNSPNTGATNSSGWTGLGGGYRDYTDGSFLSIKVYGLWWSSTEFSSTNAYSRYLSYNTATVIANPPNKNRGYSVRLIRDYYTNTAVGVNALTSNTSGKSSTAIGYDSLLLQTTGSYNTAIGGVTGVSLKTGSYNTILGANIDVPLSSSSNYVLIGDGQGNIRFKDDNTNTILPRLAGASVRMVTAGTNGELSTQTIPTGNAGTVTSVNPGTGTNFTAFTVSGNIDIDTAKVPYYASAPSNGLLKYTSGTWGVDTNTYLTSAVTSIATTGLISGGTITNTGTISTSMTTGKLVGRYSSGTGIMEEITVGSGLTLTGAGILNNTATPTPLGYYGAWQDGITQTAAVSNTGYAMIFRLQDVVPNGISIANNGSGNPTRITFANAGIYNIQFSSQFQNTGNSENDVTIWLRLMGSDVGGSSGFVSVPKTHGGGSGTPGHSIAAWNYVLDVSAGQYYELIWSTSNHTEVTMQAYAAGSPPPAAASVILTVTQQSGIMAGTGITGLGTSGNIQTGATQTLATGTTGTDFGITSSGNTHTFNLPDASASNRGALLSADWTTFNNKQNALTNPVTGTGTNNELAYFNTTGSTIGSLSTATYPSLTELSYVKGVTSGIQTQIGTKQATITGAATTITSSDLTVSRALISNASGKVDVSATTSTELGYVSGVTSGIQTQIDGKQTDSAWVNCSSQAISGWASTTTKLMQYKLLGSKTMIFQFSIVGTGTSGGTASITLPFTSSTWGDQTNIIRSRTTATLGIGIALVSASSTTLNVYPSAAMSTWNINAQRDAHGTIIINLA